MLTIHLLTWHLNKWIFLEAKRQTTCKRAARYPFKCYPDAAKANPSGSITITIGANLPTSSGLNNFPNIKPSF